MVRSGTRANGPTFYAYKKAISKHPSRRCIALPVPPPIVPLPFPLCVQYSQNWNSAARLSRGKGKIRSAKPFRDFSGDPWLGPSSTRLLILFWSSRPPVPLVAGVERGATQRHVKHPSRPFAPHRSGLIKGRQCQWRWLRLRQWPSVYSSLLPPLGDVDSREKFCAGSSGIGTPTARGKSDINVMPSTLRT